MINSEPEIAGPAAAGSGGRGAVVLAGIAVAIVIGLWFAFYLFVFTPRNAGL